MPQRFDFGLLAQAKAAPGGGVLVPALVTRAGVLTYRRADGTARRELRSVEEVFAPESLASLAYAPITDLHPDGLVSAANWRTVSIGMVGAEVKRDGEHVAADLVIQEAEAIARIDKGERKELSCGYRCDVDNTPGEHDGQVYDVVQRNIRYNHVALGPEGFARAGKETALRLDSDSAIECNEAFAVQPGGATNKGKTMPRFTLDGVDYETESEVFAQALAKHLAKKDAEVTALTKERDKEQARADSAEKELKEAKEKSDAAPKIDDLVRDRLAVCSKAQKTLGDDFKFDGKSEREIKVAAIQKQDDKFEDKDRSDDYIQARFDLLSDPLASGSTSTDKLRADTAAGTKPNQDPIMAAKAAMKEATAKAWQQPLSMVK